MKTNRFFIKHAALAIMSLTFALTSCSSDESKKDEGGCANLAWSSS